jgi:hypothetical protein
LAYSFGQLLYSIKQDWALQQLPDNLPNHWVASTPLARRAQHGALVCDGLPIAAAISAG